MKTLSEQCKKLVGSIETVWHAVGSDACAAFEEMGEEITNIEAIEMCCDADRLKTFDTEEAQDLFNTLVKEHKLEEVYGELSSQISLA